MITRAAVKVEPVRGKPRLFFLCATFIVAALCARLGAAATASYSARVGDAAHAVVVPVLDVENIPYVSLSSLSSQLGGACTRLPERVQVDLAAKTAWLQVDDTRVSASLADFSLVYPLRSYQRDVVMALSDVGPFFEQAFRVVLVREAAASPPAEGVEALTPIQAPSEGAETLTPIQAPAEEAPALEPLAPVPAPNRSRPVSEVIEAIILDPGHGGNDAGAEGADGLTERDLCYAVAQRLETALAKSGVKTVWSREKNENPSQRQRANLANASSGDLIVSIHGGASYSPAANGFELFCCSAPETVAGGQATQPAAPGCDYVSKSWEIAEKVAASVAESTGAANRGVCEVACPLLRLAAMPGFLIEIGFVTNSAEAALLKTEECRDRIVQGIMAGLSPYLKGAETKERR